MLAIILFELLTNFKKKNFHFFFFLLFYKNNFFLKTNIFFFISKYLNYKIVGELIIVFLINA